MSTLCIVFAFVLHIHVSVWCVTKCIILIRPSFTVSGISRRNFSLVQPLLKKYRGIEWFSQLAATMNNYLTVLNMLMRGITAGTLFGLRVKFDKFPSCEYNM